MSAYQNTNDKVLVSSRMYWWANLLLLLAIALVVMMLWDLGTGARFILKKLDDTLIVFSVVITPVFLILTICFGLFYGVNMLHKVAKQKATIEIACIDASTKMPKDYYLLVDSIDVDTLGTVCKRRELKEENGVRNKAVDWIFKVKGRKDVWITLCVIMGEHDDIDDSEQRKYCLKTLHSRNLYERAKDDNYKKMRVERLWYAVSAIKYVKHVELLNFDKPILIGSAVYNEETQW